MFCAFPLICPKQKDIYTVNSFSELNLSAPLLKAIAAEGYDKPTPIQARAIPELLKGRDLLGHRPDRHRQNRRLRAPHP